MGRNRKCDTGHDVSWRWAWKPVGKKRPMRLKSGDGLCEALRGMRVINIGDSLTHQLVETWRVCRVPFSPVFLIRGAPRSDGGVYLGAAPLRHRRDPLQNAGERGASRRRGRSPTATPTKRARRATCPRRSTWRTSSRASRAAAGGGGASARTRRRARTPSARRGSAATPTSAVRTGPRSSSSSRSGLGASSPGPSRSTTRAWPSAARPSGTRRATSRRTPRRPLARLTPSPRRSNTAGTRRASCRSGGRSSARARSRRTRGSARSGRSGTRPSARAWPWSTTASRTSRASRVSRVLLVLVSSSFWCPYDFAITRDILPPNTPSTQALEVMNCYAEEAPDRFPTSACRRGVVSRGLSTPSTR